MHRTPLTAILCTALAGGVAAGESKTWVPIIVEEPAGVARTNAPVTAGVPLPPGAVKATEELALLGPDGKAVPVQITPLVRLEDGSLHWVLLDFQTTLAPKAAATFTLTTKSRDRLAGPHAIRLSEVGDNRVEIDTEALHATFRRDAFDLFEEVLLEGAPIARADADVPSLSLVDGETGALCATKWGGPAKVEIEYGGPLRACVKFTGRYATKDGKPVGIDYTTRVAAFAGKPYLVVEHRIRNSDPKATRDVRIDRATLSTVLDVEDPMTYHVGAQKTLRGRFADWAYPASRTKSLYLHQTGIPRPVLDKDDWRDHARYSGTEAGYKLYTTRSKGRRPIVDLGWWAKGWIDITDTRAGLLVCVRDFAKDWPLAVGAEALRLDPTGVVRMSVDMVPPAQGTGVPRYADGHFLLNDLTHKSVTVLFNFHGPKATPEDLEASVSRFRGPLVARAPADWYNHCGAMGEPFATLDDEQATYKAWKWSFTPGQVPKDPHAPERFVMYTDVHWVSEADDATDNLIQFLRTGERGSFDRGAAWARYHRDTYAPRSDGFDYTDKRPAAKGQKPFSPAERRTLGSWFAGCLRGDLTGLCHAYGGGLIDHYLLTGERESLAAAEDIAEIVAARTARAVPGQSSAGGRGSGRHLIIACRVFEGTRKKKWRDLMTRLGRVCATATNRDERGMTPTGGYGWGGPARTPRGKKLIEDLALKPHDVPTSGTWGDALFVQGLDRYYHLTGDEDARDLVIGYGELMNRYGIHKTLHCASYYYQWDFPRKGDVWFTNLDGELEPKPGNDWYSTSVTDVAVRAYRHTGRAYLLDQGRRFWTIGRQNLHDPAQWFAPQPVKGFMGARHTSYAKLLFREYARPRKDAEPPAAISDLAASVSDSDVTLTWTAPVDKGGTVARYQVKRAALPIVSYADYDYARDDGKKRNWWFATNVSGEPSPGKPGARQRFVLKGLRAGVHYVAVRSRDAAFNESAISNVVRVEVK